MMRSRRAAISVLAVVGAAAFALGRWTRPAGVAAAEPSVTTAAVAVSSKLLTEHVGETFENQTVYLSGQAFVRCKFNACTLVVRESAYHIEQCVFDRCNWHIDWLVPWGDSAATRELQALATMLDAARREGDRSKTPATQPRPGQ